MRKHLILILFVLIGLNFGCQRVQEPPPPGFDRQEWAIYKTAEPGLCQAIKTGEISGTKMFAKVMKLNLQLDYISAYLVNGPGSPQSRKEKMIEQFGQGYYKAYEMKFLI